MRETDFIEPTAGSLLPTINNHKAFIPAALPPQYDQAKITIKLSNATLALGELKGACRRLQNANILIKPLQRQEALTSSAMEGTYTTADKLLLAEAGLEKNTDDSTKEVINYITALSEAFNLLETYPLCHKVLKSAHKKLLEGLSTERGSRKKPGEYKSEQNFIGSNARFIPPPPDATQKCMDDLEKYLNRGCNSKAEALIDIALAHYQLEAIHPFSDGNGRLGRMLITIMSVTHGLLERPVLYISPSIENDKDQYIDLMYNISTKGEWTEWLNFFFDKVTESCDDTVQTIDQLLSLQDNLKKEVSNSIRSANALNLIDILFEYPAITATSAAKKLSITYAAAKNLIEKLVELKILFLVPDTYPKTYIAWEIIQVARPNSTQT